MGKFLEKLFGKKKKEEQNIKNDNSTLNNENVQINNVGNQNNIDNIQPITFNQNINTEVKPVNPLGFEPMAPVNNDFMNNANNAQLNVISGMQNTQAIGNNNMNNVVDTNNTLEPTTSLSNNNLQPQVTEPVLNPSVMDNNQNQEPITFNGQPQTPAPMQGLNVIPTMGPTPNPTNTNQNM